ncbi:TonB-dependent receptor [Asticcacaulis sp.]|uniref:TonB-dependent receptor n=1 Tax=Asticcacaulis sp. TaxID=1872648 RepID=UPI002B75B8E9|nr:TonB-dependent receptor [Asticcacaulis sp.]HTM81564.1 TonB-dependent receptor [Asticcacaulis sp.]
MKMRNCKTNSRACNISMIALVIGASIFCSTDTYADDGKIKFNIPAESTAKALNDFSTQASIQILFPYEVAARTTVLALKGEYSRQEALAQLLASSGLEVASQTDKTITLRVSERQGQTANDVAPTEVIVTGSHIRGGNPTSPVHSISQKEIQQSGYSQVGDLIRSLPESFGGGQNPGVIGADFANIGNSNSSGASTANLRGLGTDATLVLVNGHRLTGDVASQGVDISPIPIGAIQRVEVVTDGASSLYGADAVAGVVNFILRKNYDGLEVAGNVGVATRGGTTTRTVSVLAGRSGAKGRVLANLEYAKIDGLTTEDRDYTSAATTVSDLIQPIKRRSLFVSGGYDFSDRVALSGDVLVADRVMTGQLQQFASSPRLLQEIYTPSYSAATTLDVTLSRGWKGRVIAVASGSRNAMFSAYPDYGVTNNISYANSGRYLEVNADGTAVRLPSGDVKLAVGAGYRTEAWRNSDGTAPTRDVTYAFAEVLAPLVLPSATRTGLHALDLSLSGRAERYSDFGSSGSPKIGLRYVPFADLTVRATWGKSFKAPSFQQMYSPSIVYLWNASDVGGTGSGAALMTYGGNPNLKPEKSTSKTLGIDYAPSTSIKFSATWFDIDYTDRVVAPVSRYYLGLSDPTYAPFIELAPTKVRQDQVIAAADTFYNFSAGAYDPTNVVAIINDANANANAQTVQGLDVAYRQSFDAFGGILSTFANATALKLRQQTSAAAPNLTLSGTVLNVPSFKARAGATWLKGGLSATAFANYIASETDDLATPIRTVAPWTTIDTTISYQFGGSSGFARGLTVAISIANFFDKMPPYAFGVGLNYPGIDFDSTNTSVVGRFASIAIKKAW